MIKTDVGNLFHLLTIFHFVFHHIVYISVFKCYRTKIKVFKYCMICYGMVYDRSVINFITLETLKFYHQLLSVRTHDRKLSNQVYHLICFIILMFIYLFILFCT